MTPCSACAGESIRLVGENQQKAAGCAFCTAVSLQRIGFTDKPENHCGCYAKTPNQHQENHKDTKLIGRQFQTLNELEKVLEPIPVMERPIADD